VNCRSGAHRLARFLSTLEGFSVLPVNHGSYEHMGATITDTVLQAGLNYRTVVEPRVQALRQKYPGAKSTTGFLNTIAYEGLKTLLDWNHPEKPQRVLEMTYFFSNERIETEGDLRKWMSHPGNSQLLLGLRGVGPKTLDYLKLLIGIPSVAVDRHIRVVVQEAGLTYKRYADVKEVVGITAEILDVELGSLDRAIWSYMSTRKAAMAMA